MSDIKRKRREAIRVPDDYDGPLALGESASDQNRFWFVRAQSWSEGADVNSYADVIIENEENLRKAQVPYEDYQPGPQSDMYRSDGVDSGPSGPVPRAPSGRAWSQRLETRKR
jgi:hypothetical protein